MSVLIIGSDGNMGRRYQAVLKYLGKEVILVDKQHSRHYVASAVGKASGLIIATPTDTHASIIREFASFKKPILCEKPVTKSVEDLKKLRDEIRGTPFRMVFQYQLLAPKDRLGRSCYDYFKHGNDGLAWDCLQVIAMSRQRPDLEEVSPIWKCIINGKALSLSHMDAAYIAYVQEWFKKPAGDMGEIIAAHEKTDAIARETANGLH